MPELQICHFCELFGFNASLNPVGRLALTIGDTTYPPGYEFVSGNQYGYFDISKNIDNLALVYPRESNAIVLHVFVPDGKTKNALVNCTPEKILFRYSKLKYIEDMYETGHMRIASAIEYLKYESDEARQDNELIHSKLVSGSSVSITDKDGKSIIPIGNVTFSSVMFSLDSYLLCLSYDYDERFYKWFKDADACLVIENVDEFAQRVYAAFSKAMPSHTGFNGRVTYGNHQSELGVLFSKPKEFLYQREYRFSWIPETSERIISPEIITRMDIDKLRPIIPTAIDIYAGSLKDISRIVRKSA